MLCLINDKFDLTRVCCTRPSHLCLSQVVCSMPPVMKARYPFSLCHETAGRFTLASMRCSRSASCGSRAASAGISKGFVLAAQKDNLPYDHSTLVVTQKRSRHADDDGGVCLPLKALTRWNGMI